MKVVCAIKSKYFRVPNFENLNTSKRLAHSNLVKSEGG